jgi:hypothetical protein
MANKLMSGKSTIVSIAALAAVLAIGTAVRAAKPPFPTAKKFSHALQTVTGINLVTGIVANHVASSVLEHKLGGKVHAKVKIYNMTDLLDGKVKSVEFTFKDPSLKGVQVGKLHVASNGPLWVCYRKHDGLKPGILSPVLFTLDGNVSQAQVAEALKSPKIESHLSALKLDLPGLGDQQLSFFEPHVALKDGKVNIDTTLITAGGSKDTGVPITLNATPFLSGDSQIRLKDLAVVSKDIEDPKEFAGFLTGLFNPLVNFARMDRLDHAFRLQNLVVKDNELDFNGRLLLAPKPANAKVVESLNAKK